LAKAIAQHSTPATLVVVDCLTLWLTNELMPADLIKIALQPSQIVREQLLF